MKTELFESFFNKPSKFDNWEQVFENPQPIIIETLKTGKIITKISGILNLDNPNASEIKDGYAEIPVLAHLIRHEVFGDYLVDTGFDSAFGRQPGGNFKGLYKRFYFKNRYSQDKESDGIENQIIERKVNLKGVFLTHIHEHASGAPSLPDDIPYYFGDGERDEKIYPFVYSNFFKGKKFINKIDFTSAQQMPILGGCIDVFGDGSFWAISTPGHTKGHISYIVNGLEEKVLITGDECITRKGFELGIETGKHSYNIKQGRECFLRISSFAQTYPFVKLKFGHETDEYSVKYLE